jgi:hypothetical protein
MSGGSTTIDHVEVKDASALIAQDEEDEEDPRGRRRDREEVDRDDLLGVDLKEGPPALGARLPAAHHRGSRG